jgi:hypothetical protein
VDGIAFCEFTDVDVVRHPLVQKIVVAYEQRDKEVRDSRAPNGPKVGPQLFPRPGGDARPSEPPPTVAPPSSLPATVARLPETDDLPGPRGSGGKVS